MLYCLIVDDEPLARQVLENYISRMPGLQIVGACANAVEAYKKLHEQPVDILFLDIKMPLINGLTFLRSLKQPPAVVLTTAFTEYAVESYELNAIDYLLKPFSYERFCRSIEKVMKIKPPEEVAELKDYVFIKADNNLVKVFHHDILYIEARKDYLKVVTTNNSHLTHMTMKHIVSILPPRLFTRIHRSYIVSLAGITVKGKGFIEMNGIVLPVGERYKEQLQRAFESNHP
jgi:DNA-binding LytR/AlgR family response regulator